MNKTTVIIADDHHLLRKGAISVIEEDSGFVIKGEASNGEEALSLILEKKPDIAIIDIDMPKLTGLDVIKSLREKNILTKFVIITGHKDKAYFTESLKLDVKAYVLKDSIANDLLDCLRAVALNEYYISPKLSGYLIEANKSKQKPDWYYKLTKQELKILKLVSENKTSRQISEELFISIKTVENHRNNIISKLGLKGYNSLLCFSQENKDHL